MALDLRQLNAELEAAKAHFNSWVLNSIETADNTRQRHLDFIRDSKVEMEKLEDRQQELSQQAQILKQRLQQESAQEVELQARLAALQAEGAVLPRQVAQLEARLAAEREQLQRQQARLAAESRQQERTLHRLTADLQTYRLQLGMRIVSQSDPEGPQELRIVLTLLDSQDHGREFCLGVVLEEDTYKARSCILAGPCHQRRLSLSENKPMPSQPALPDFVPDAQPAAAAARRCQLLQPGAGSRLQLAAPDYLEGSLQPAILHPRQLKFSREDEVTEIFCSAVTHCQPECSAMVELLRELNGNGNFGQFIRSMRKAWQQQCL